MLLLQQYPEESTIKILDVGSGPEYLAVADIITNLSKQKRKIELTASEVDVSGIIALKQKQKSPDSPLVDVKYLDLNLIPEIPPKNIIADAYDVVTARLVLHQLSLTDIHYALRFFVTIVAANGFIINPDVGPCRFYQALLVPANNVDREGNVPLWTEHDFTKSAVKISATHSKIAYPLLDSYQGFTNSDIPMYTFIAYQVLVVPSELIAELNLLWKQ